MSIDAVQFATMGSDELQSRLDQASQDLSTPAILTPDQVQAVTQKFFDDQGIVFTNLDILTIADTAVANNITPLPMPPLNTDSVLG